MGFSRKWHNIWTRFDKRTFENKCVINHIVQRLSKSLNKVLQWIDDNNDIWYNRTLIETVLMRHICHLNRYDWCWKVDHNPLHGYTIINNGKLPLGAKLNWGAVTKVNEVNLETEIRILSQLTRSIMVTRNIYSKC